MGKPGLGEKWGKELLELEEITDDRTLGECLDRGVMGGHDELAGSGEDFAAAADWPAS